VIFIWLGAVVIGLSLGLLGSGGSILTVPVLVYLVQEPQKLAIAESLAIVGGISLMGALPYARKKLIHWKSVVWFGIPGVAGTYLGAYFSQWLSGAMQLLLFAFIMLAAAYTMWRAKNPSTDKDRHHPYWKIMLEGLAVGIITGLVGVGGGFLIIPALVLLGGLSMRLAVGTSLLIIALKSFVGFFKYLEVLGDYQVNWGLIALFVGLGIAGSFTGSFLSQKLPQQLLRKVFAVVLVGLGIFILYQNIPGILGYSLSIETVAITVLFSFALLIVLTRKEGISVKEVQTLEGDFLVVDVREPYEFVAGHVATAKNVPLSQFKERFAEIPKDKKVYVICRSGRRSRRALHILREAGYRKAYPIRGGMLAWQMAQLPVVKDKDNKNILASEWL
jgi:uncharacterized membrane protein YfcA/rhodanese-related sulfurtransferase